jgi:hypothetical protein
MTDSGLLRELSAGLFRKPERTTVSSLIQPATVFFLYRIVRCSQRTRLRKVGDFATGLGSPNVTNLVNNWP